MHKLAVILGSAVLVLAGTARAQTPALSAMSYPDKPIRFIVPFPAGSGTDSSARFVAHALSELTKQPVFVDNRAGANGLIAAQAAAHSPADGYTVFITTMTTQSVNPHLYRRLPYDPEKDFSPVALFTRSPMVMVVRNTDDQPKNLSEFTAYAKKRLGSINYATGNTSSRVGAEFYGRAAGLRVTPVSYRGTPQALSDLLGGQVDFMFVDPAPSVPLIKAGKLRALAVTASDRLPNLPDVPTTAEEGMPDFQLLTWVGAFVPANTPKSIVERLSEFLLKTLRTKEAADFYGKNGVQLTPMQSEKFSAFVKAEYEMWGSAVRSAGIEPE